MGLMGNSMVPAMHTGDIFALCDHVRDTSFALHRFLRHGHLEKVYENGLASRLRNAGLTPVTQQHPIAVMDENGAVLGEYFADLFIESRLVVELKACRALTDEHIAELLGYLRATRLEHGLLINFGAPKLEIRKIALSAVAEPDPFFAPSVPFCGQSASIKQG